MKAEMQDYVDQAIAMLRESGSLYGEEKLFVLAVLEGRVDDIVQREKKRTRMEELETQSSELRRELAQEELRAFDGNGHAPAIGHGKAGDAAQG